MLVVVYKIVVDITSDRRRSGMKQKWRVTSYWCRTAVLCVRMRHDQSNDKFTERIGREGAEGAGALCGFEFGLAGETV